MKTFNKHEYYYSIIIPDETRELDSKIITYLGKLDLSQFPYSLGMFEYDNKKFCLSVTPPIMSTDTYPGTFPIEGYMIFCNSYSPSEKSGIKVDIAKHKDILRLSNVEVMDHPLYGAKYYIGLLYKVIEELNNYKNYWEYNELAYSLT